MPTLVCRTCGRVLFTTAPLSDLFAEERRCPRCGAFMDSERREGNRRKADRRENPTEEPGPPGKAERRVADRRVGRRRKGDRGPYTG
jgi:phage FluMu protein Com